MDEKTFKKLVQAAGIITSPSTGIPIATFMKVYDKVYQRYERPDYSLYPGFYDYEKVKKFMPRERISILIDKNTLQGYYYKNKEPLGLVITAHGIHAGADDYLPIQKYFYDHGFSVFSFDYRGTYDSNGDSNVGGCESLVDLDKVLEYITTHDKFMGLPIFLFGHSWGGYACLASLCLNYDIKAVATIGAMNDGASLVNEKAKEYAGIMSRVTWGMVMVYQRYLFRQYNDYNSTLGINSKNIPIMVFHGVDDKVINYYEQSVFAHKDEIKNPNCIFYPMKGIFGDHNDIMLSLDAILYRKEVESDLNIYIHEHGGIDSDDLRREFYKTINHERYSNPNEDVLAKILSMYLSTLK